MRLLERVRAAISSIRAPGQAVERELLRGDLEDVAGAFPRDPARAARRLRRAGFRRSWRRSLRIRPVGRGRRLTKLTSSYIVPESRLASFTGAARRRQERRQLPQAGRQARSGRSCETIGDAHRRPAAAVLRPDAPARAGRPRRRLIGLVGRGIQSSRTPVMHEREGAPARHRLLLSCCSISTGWACPTRRSARSSSRRAGSSASPASTSRIPSSRRSLPLLDAVARGAQRSAPSIRSSSTDGSAHRPQHRLLGLCREFPREHGRLLPLDRGRAVRRRRRGRGGRLCAAGARASARLVDRRQRRRAGAEQLAARLSARFGGRVEAPSDAAAGARAARRHRQHDAGRHGEISRHAVRPDLLSPRQWVADIVYFPAETELLRAARALGCRTLPGTGMAIYQAVRAFELFTGRHADRRRDGRPFRGGSMKHVHRTPGATGRTAGLATSHGRNDHET